MRGEIESLIGDLDLSDCVSIAGWKSNAEVRELMTRSRAMVLASFAEGLPVVIMEALALHRPVVSTYVAGIPELVEPGECGWLAPPGSVMALADALRSVLESPLSTLERMGAHGASLVAEKHDAVREAGKLLRLFTKSPINDSAGQASDETTSSLASEALQPVTT